MQLLTAKGLSHSDGGSFNRHFFISDTHTAEMSDFQSTLPCTLHNVTVCRSTHRSTPPSNRYRFAQSPATKPAAIPAEDVRWRWHHCHRHHSTCRSCTCSTVCKVPPARGKGRPLGEAHQNQRRSPQPVQNRSSDLTSAHVLIPY